MTNATFRNKSVSKLPWFRGTLACLVGAILLATFDSAAAAEWKTLKPPSEGFTCEMPGEAKPLTQKVDTAAGQLEVVLYFVELADSAYLVNSTKIPANAIEATTDERLDGARDGAVNNSKGKLIDEKKITVQGNPGRQLLIEQPGGIYTQLKVVMANERLIQVLVVSKSKEPTADTKRFFDSFKLVKE